MRTIACIRMRRNPTLTAHIIVNVMLTLHLVRIQGRGDGGDRHPPPPKGQQKLRKCRKKRIGENRENKKGEKGGRKEERDERRRKIKREKKEREVVRGVCRSIIRKIKNNKLLRTFAVARNPGGAAVAPASAGGDGDVELPTLKNANKMLGYAMKVPDS